MRKVIYYCDHCGKEIPEKEVYEISVSTADTQEPYADPEISFAEKCFCRDCMKLIKRYAVNLLLLTPESEPKEEEGQQEEEQQDQGELSQPAEAEADQQEEEKKIKDSKKQEPKKKVDDGRIMALFEAKRSPVWIAKDMGISVQTVYNHLKKLGLLKDKE